MRSPYALALLLFAGAFTPTVGALARAAPCLIADCGNDEGSSDECPPDCGAGCQCCARTSALPPATVISSVIVPEVRTTEYAVHADRAPTTPEPRGQDAVPRAA